jgi:hypothetical protein
MPRNFDDIIPPSRRRMMDAQNQAAPQNIPPSNTTPLPPIIPVHVPMSGAPTPPPRVRIKVGRSFPYGTALIVVVIIAVCAGALYAFAGAEVKITPMTQTGTVSGDFTATNGTGDLSYTVINLSKTDSALVPAESTVIASDTAQGTITISNAQSVAQNLITNTRFATPDGLIFRIHSAITIPAEGASGPGAITATVFADQAGQNYNVGPTSFTVPGLKGDKSYTLVTANSSAAMSGGFSGTRPAVSATTDATHQATLQSELAKELQSQLKAKIPAGFVVVPGGSMTNYQTQPDTASSTNSVQISETGTVEAVAFPSQALAKAIAYKIAGTYSGEPIDLASVNTLTLAPDATSTDPASASTYSFQLSGNVMLIWQIDASKIAGAVAGKTRDSAQSILSGFPEVQSANLILRPFWSSTFPQDPSHIHVTVSSPKV